jgi:hypothetical protein
LLFGRKFNMKRAYKLNSNVQKSFFYVKIGFKILTTYFTKNHLQLK